MTRVYCCFFFQAEDGIRDLVRSRGLGDVYKRQLKGSCMKKIGLSLVAFLFCLPAFSKVIALDCIYPCLLYTSDAADDLLCVDLGGRRIIKKKTYQQPRSNLKDPT